MRRYSLFTIVLLCLAILLVDLLSYYWLSRITELHLSPTLQTLVDVLFWFFTFGLISAILVLKLRLDSISAERRNRLVTSLYGLTVSSFAPKVIFVLVISILYTLHFVFSEGVSVFVVPILGLISGVIPFMVILYAIFVSVYRFRTVKQQIKFENLPQAFKGLRIVHISDLHLGSFNRRYHILDRAIEKINQLKPDYILFTGDLVNNYAWELDGWQEAFSKLDAKKGKYAVLGNHDYGDYSEWVTPEEKAENFSLIQKFYEDTGFILLRNESCLQTEEQNSLAIVGVENWGKPPFRQYGDLSKALSGANGADFKILMSHDPTHWSEEVVYNTDIDLTLSGHTHGLQAGFRYRNRHWSPAKFKYKHWAGLYSNESQYLYVNRGLGWMGFPGRIGMRPEITLLELN
ncbi:metallophosphoesterase [Aureitalea sp. L0-47]|uniref:metallophosphoesterase n=1 Tax=Aureitalea sp. L0-47 TaxID=2816962 RepID=UPI002236F32F|nr:metallophosphoesterase [Aureitalea sp. L0-47]MCW5518894.1 metallophosphoesterase [Aureitalea sp. L0-47]